MATLWHAWFNAQAFFTRLRCPYGVDYAPRYQRLAIGLWPLVGWLVGALAALPLLWPLPPALAALAALAVAVWLTGALHEDGFADVCDGFGSGARDPQRVLAIMRDPRAGAFAVVGVALLLLAKFVALAELVAVAPWPLAAAVVVNAHALSRFLAGALVYLDRYVGAGGRGGAMTEPMTRPVLLLSASFGLAPLTLLAGAPRLLLTALVAALAVGYCRRLFLRRLGGYSGDCLGAAQQLAETAVYVSASALLTAR